MSSAKQSVGSSVMSLLTSKSLSSMVKGIRTHKTEHAGNRHAEGEFIAKCMAEIKEELKTNFPDVKAVAIQKLIYLQMIGYDISWSAFHIIELMSAAWFGHKRIGYLAASLSFTKETDVILLTTHLFRKGFNSSQGGGPTTSAMAVEGFQYETGAAISCLANIVTPDLAQDLLSDVYGLMNSSRPYIRKKAVLVLLKMFKAWPKALRLSFDRLKEKLDDENQGVVSAAVYVICELAAKNPKNYLGLAPQFFKILTTSSNNWVLIKVVKLLGSLVPLEPRLAKKLTEPLCDIISTTPAKSLLYEAVNTLLSGELRSKTVVKLCLEKLRNFIEDADQNLKYLGLLGLHKLLQKQPRVVAEHKDLILACLSDEDVTIRMRALDLITSMVSLKNLAPIVAKLLAHLEASEGVGHYREHVLARILHICAQDSFAYVSDFEWYTAVLVDLTLLSGISRENALSISAQLLEVVVRVPGVRSYTIKHMINILLANRLGGKSGGGGGGGAGANNRTAALNSTPNAASTQGHMCEVLHAVGFIIGEYTEYLEEQDDDFYAELLSALSRAEVVSALPPAVQNVFVHTMIKILSAALAQPFDNAHTRDNLSTLKSRAPTRKNDGAADDAAADGGEGDEVADEPKPESAPPPAEDDMLAEEEEDDFDAHGLRKRKHPSLKRTFAQWHAGIARLLNILHAQLPLFTRADSVEVQERAVAYLQLVRWLIVQGQWESQIDGWTGAKAAGAEERKEEKSEEKAPAPAAPAAAAPAPVKELNLLGSLDPFGSDSAAATLSIFDTPAPAKSSAPAAAVASPPTDLFSSLAISGPSVASNAPAALKEKLRSLAIQLALLFSERLNPVNPRAQKKVSVPRGLDLTVEINPGACDAIAADEADDDEIRSDSDDDNPYSTKPRKSGAGSSSKPRGGLYDDDFDAGLGGGGFGARVARPAGSRGKASKDEYASSGGGFLDEVDPKRPQTAAEKDDARRRAERRRQAHANDPYYIKDNSSSSSSSASAAAALNVDHIPVRRLEDDDLPGLKVVKSGDSGDILGGSSSSDSATAALAARKPKVFKVLKEDDMPDSDDDEGGKRGGKKSSKDRKKDKKKDAKASAGSDSDNALDMDLTTPLGADELMPRMKSYAETQAEKAKAAAAASKASEKDGDKERKHRSKRDKHSREHSRDRDGKKKHKDKEHRDRKDSKHEVSASGASTAAASKPAAPATASLFDLFDPMGGAPAAAAPAPSSSSSSSSHRKSSSAAPSASPSSSSSSSSSDARLRDTTVYRDSSVRIKASCAYASGSSVSVSIDVLLSSDNSKKIASLPKLTLELKPGKHVRAFHADAHSKNARINDKGVLSLTLRDVAAGAARTERFTVDFSSTLDRAFTLAGRVSYTADRDGKGKEGESAELVVPASTFIAARKMSTQEMASALSGSNPPTKLASAALTLKRTKVADALRSVAALLNVALVEAVSFTATYYGVTVSNGSSVAVLVKARKGDESALSVEIKSTSSQLSEALLEEVTHKLK